MKRKTILAACLVAAGAVAASAQTTSATANPSPRAPVNNVDPNPNPPGSGKDVFTSNTEQRTFVVTGTVVRARDGRLVVRIDDHRHTMPFELSSGVEPPAPGSKVAVTYRPTGATGQAAEQIQVLEEARRSNRNRAARDAAQR
jgi:hypothetical protein